ncbi:MAG: hypothetical protein RB292_02730 [Patescibacteria group bacterium]|jgi:DNA-binding NtrC family response regulator|nr:hypothetical protein [Patescibacteria group bacterium]
MKSILVAAVTGIVRWSVGQVLTGGGIILKSDQWHLVVAENTTEAIQQIANPELVLVICYLDDNGQIDPVALENRLAELKIVTPMIILAPADKHPRLMEMIESHQHPVIAIVIPFKPGTLVAAVNSMLSLPRIEK